jgi:hypothetical protein
MREMGLKDLDVDEFVELWNHDISANHPLCMELGLRVWMSMSWWSFSHNISPKFLCASWLRWGSRTCRLTSW